MSYLKILLQIADDFIENIINGSCQIAKHRKSNILEIKDVQFHLGKIKILQQINNCFKIMCF
jgi:transcription initiation factor TFIID subunit TAF12